MLCFSSMFGARTSMLESRGAERGGRVAGLRVLVRALSRRGVVVGCRGVVEGGLVPSSWPRPWPPASRSFWKPIIMVANASFGLRRGHQVKLL